MTFRVALIIAIVTLLLPAAPAQARRATRPETLLAAMTLEQKVGQLFMVSMCGEGLPEASAKFIRQMMPGGLALFTCNGSTPAEVTTTVNAWQAAAVTQGAGVPLLVAIDQEGGSVTRLAERDGFSALPAGWAMGAMPAADAEIVGGIAAVELGAVGITMNLAPVADVQTIRTNVLMDRRTFGSDPANVSAKTVAYVRGLQKNGVIGVLKHFPGHGDAGDTHTVLPVIDYEGMRVRELVAPFRDGIAAGVDAIMVGHLIYPALDPQKLPASLSKPIVTDFLRMELGFRGVVMTDAMDMGAIADNYERDQAAVLAVNAGVDVIVTGPHMPSGAQTQMWRALLDAAKAGTLPEARLNEAVLRILTLKDKYRLLDWKALDSTLAAKRVDSVAHRAALEQVWRHTATIARNDGKLLPRKPGGRTLLLFPGIYPAVQRECLALDPTVKSYAYSQRPVAAEIAASVGLARNADAVIIFTYDAFYESSLRDLVRALPPEKTIVAALQNPYDLAIFPGLAGYAAVYMPVNPAFRALCGVLYGATQAQGILPISLN